MSNPTWGSSQFSFSETGRLAYLNGKAGFPEYQMVWVDREGRSEAMTSELRTYSEPRFSPDGTKLALGIAGTSADAWVYDLKRGVFTRLTFDENSTVPVWSPDAKYIAFSSTGGKGSLNLYMKAADGTGEAEQLTDTPRTQFLSSWSPDGKYLLYAQSNADTANDLYVLPLEGDRKPEPYLETPFSELEAAFSPDGRWIVYQSNESGDYEIYVRPFPPRGGKWQVSEGGGTHPRWARNGRELYYRTQTGLMVVEVDPAGDSFQAEKPRVLFEGPFAKINVSGSTYADYDVAPDGRFVMFLRGESESTDTHVTLMTHWFDELHRLLAVKH